MERVEKTVVNDPDGVFYPKNKTSRWTPMKKSRRDEFMISDNLWEYSDWGHEINGKLQEGSQEDKLRILPEELVEKILSMVPFPYVFKARVLSKSWLARLSPISSQDDEEKKHLAISFQKQMRQWSVNWKVFCPVHDVSEDDLLAYDRSSYSWQRLPSLSFLRSGVDWTPEWGPIRCSFEGSVRMSMDGALLSWANEEELYVANILTQEWKQLPPCPNQEHWNWSRIILNQALETYKVILIPYQEEDPEWETLTFIQIYDSVTDSWSSVKAPLPIAIDLGYLDNTVYMDGVLYFVTQHDNPSTGTLFKVMSIGIKEESLVEEPVTVAQVEFEKERYLSVKSVICNSNLLIIILKRWRRPNLVIRIDCGRKQVLGVSQCPPDYPQTRGMSAVISNGDYIFKDVEMDGSGVLAYNVHADQWELLPYCMESGSREMWEVSREESYSRSGREWYASCSFRPGLNPFAAV